MGASPHARTRPSVYARRLMLATALLLLPWMALAAPDAASRFLQANRLYEQGDYESAAQSYQAILHSGTESAAVHFNLGNAFFRTGQLGRAIAHYRQAQLLAPRDPDIRANLIFARQQVAGATSVIPQPWVRKLGQLRLAEWTGLTLAGVWLTFGYLTLGQWRPALRRRLRPWCLATATATLALLAATATAWHQATRAPLAVVLHRDEPVRYGPLDESQVHFTAHEGSELTVEDRQGGWVQVADAGQRVGWVRRESLWLPD